MKKLTKKGDVSRIRSRKRLRSKSRNSRGNHTITRKSTSKYNLSKNRNIPNITNLKYLLPEAKNYILEIVEDENVKNYILEMDDDTLMKIYNLALNRYRNSIYQKGGSGYVDIIYNNRMAFYIGITMMSIIYNAWNNEAKLASLREKNEVKKANEEKKDKAAKREKDAMMSWAMRTPS